MTRKIFLRHDASLTVGDFATQINDRSTEAERLLGLLQPKDEEQQSIHDTASLGDAKPTNSAA